VLIAVLLVVVILSLAAYRFTESMTAEYRASTRVADVAQARANAVSGVYYAAAMLADTDSFQNKLAGNPYDNDGMFRMIPVRPDDNNPAKAGYASLKTVVSDGQGGYLEKHGVSDESGKINPNALIQLDATGQTLFTALMALQPALPDLTEEIAAAIVDWVDADDVPFNGIGAESDTYTSQNPPYRAKNGPLNSIDELLLVRGMTPQLLYGNDRNRNGKQDDNQSDPVSRGLADFLTVYGRYLNVDSTGVRRINLKDSDDMPGLYGKLKTAVGDEMAAYIMAYKLWGAATIQTSSGSGSGSQSGSGSGGQSGTSTGSGSGGGSNQSSSGNTGSNRNTGTSGSMGSSAPVGSSGSGGVAASVSVTSTGTMTVTVGGQSKSSSSGSGGSGSGGNSNSSGNSNQPTTRAATQQELAAAVDAALAASPTNKQQPSSVMAFYNTQVTLPKPQQQPGQPTPPTLTYTSPLNDPTKLAQYLPALLDKTSATGDVELLPRININTAPREVLMAIPGLADTDADNIINLRDAQSPLDPATLTGAWLVTAGGFPADKFSQVEQYVTGRTMVYRVQSIGYFGQGGPQARVEAVIDTNQGAPRVLFFRDLGDLDTPRGFDPPRQ
jgi:type II secretory pathway component PulK